MSAITPCPNCARLERELARTQADLSEAHRRLSQAQDELNVLGQRLTDLETQVRRGKRQASPFGRDRKKSDPKRPGRRPGSGEFSHQKAPAQEQITDTHEAKLGACPDCQGPVTNVRDQVNYQIDIPDIRPTVVCFKTQVGYCPCCGRMVHSSHPEQIGHASGAAATCIGPNARAFATDLKQRLGVPYAKICEIFQTVFDLKVSPSALCQSDARLARIAEPIYQDMIAALRACQSVHADETGWRINALSAWLWTFTCEHLTVYTVESGRGHEVVVRILGAEFKGTLVADCFTAYDHKALAAWLQQKCYAHLIKDLAALEREKTRGAVRFPRELIHLFREALSLRDQKAQLEPAVFQEKVASLEARLDKLIDGSRHFTDPDNKRFAKRLRKQRQRLFTFLTHDGVEATNNRAERALRPAVITRKTGGCNKTDKGAMTHAVLASLLVTARNQGQNTLHYLKAVLNNPHKAPSLVTAPNCQTIPAAQSP